MRLNYHSRFRRLHDEPQIPGLPLNEAESMEPIRQIVDSADTHVYFYSDVFPDKTFLTIKELRRIDMQLQTEALSRYTSVLPPIWLHINSYGGETVAGLAIANVVSTLVAPVYTIIEGVCASAATFMAVTAKRRFITQDSFFMLHQLSAGMIGTHEDFRDEFNAQKKMMGAITTMYARNCKNKLDEEAVKQILTRNTWLTAEETIEHGFADELWTGKPA